MRKMTNKWCLTVEKSKIWFLPHIVTELISEVI